MKVTIFLLVLLFTMVCQANSERFIVKSKIIDENPTVQVSLPDTYSHSDSYQYPLLLVLDGSTQFSHIAASTQFLSTYAIIPEMIVVSVSTQKRMTYFTPTAHEKFVGRSGKADLFKGYLQKELIPYISNKYRVAPYYAVTGHSLGGLFTSNLVLDNNSKFGLHISISPSLWWEKSILVNNYKALSDNHLSSPKRWFLSIASESGEMFESYTAMINALNEQPLSKLHWFSEHFPEETHDSTPLIGNARALKKIFNNWNAVPEIDVMPLHKLHDFYLKKIPEYGYHFTLSAHQYNVYGLKAVYEGKHQWGIEILEQGVKEFGKSEILWDSLATAYKLNKQLVKALHASNTALKLAKTSNSIYLSDIISQNEHLNTVSNF
ncbi:hypothetical protein PSECIP111854_03597 [Pseudoalteromonas sp. CIP111854]|uniref:Alpha/beta hydrolase n=1 Tax=Pseudoalteromonas holothuriae TaxID=2963714 RepID=A0A9W4R3H8_9GAMM|nr:alpha/beta hydrolase-fold protein [Pseudoalteromonas sp. CIP111854]CAH9065055.1 hypothetical protein PSECIP111854_03597 [Pseudoalteromonas sp. CIP111854]